MWADVFLFETPTCGLASLQCGAVEIRYANEVTQDFIHYRPPLCPVTSVGLSVHSLPSIRSYIHYNPLAPSLNTDHLPLPSLPSSSIFIHHCPHSPLTTFGCRFPPSTNIFVYFDLPAPTYNPSASIFMYFQLTTPTYNLRAVASSCTFNWLPLHTTFVR